MPEKMHTCVDTIALSTQHFSSFSKCRPAKIVKEYALSSEHGFDAEEIGDHPQAEKLP